jgi:hypothetical protein
MPRYRSDCAGKSRSACRRSKRCHPVRKSTRSREHCRIRRSISQKEKKDDATSPKRKDRPSTSKGNPNKSGSANTHGTQTHSSTRSARVAAGKRKLWQVARELSPQKCSDFSLKQRGNTCFMSAATLTVGRTMMPYIKDDAVRRFVRYSMANDWDEAQGGANEGTCPRIPKRVRQYYAALYEKAVKIKANRTPTWQAHEMTCVTNDTCKMRHLTEGGQIDFFTVALLWGSNVPCHFAQQILEWHHNTWPKTQIPRNLMEGVLLERDSSVPFHVVTFTSRSKMSLRLDGIYVRLLFRVLDSVHARLLKAGRAVLSVGLGVVDDAETFGHAIALFPCLVHGQLTWTLCDSNNPRCTKDANSYSMATYVKKQMTCVRTMTFLVHVVRR